MKIIDKRPNTPEAPAVGDLLFAPNSGLLWMVCHNSDESYFAIHLSNGEATAEWNSIGNLMEWMGKYYENLQIIPSSHVSVTINSREVLD